MPHTIVVAETSIPLREVVEIGRHGGRSLLRFQPLDSGDVLVLAPAGARIDGRPMLGGLAVVDWGTGALVRSLHLRVEVRWEAAREVRTAAEAGRCALCYGAVGREESIVVCRCETAVHEECAAAMISCPSCGASAEAPSSGGTS